MAKKKLYVYINGRLRRKCSGTTKKLIALMEWYKQSTVEELEISHYLHDGDEISLYIRKETMEKSLMLDSWYRRIKRRHIDIVDLRVYVNNK